MKRFIKLISIILVLANLLSIPFSASALAAVEGGSPANSLLGKWQDYGLVDKSITNSDLDKAVQKIDFISFINGIMKTAKKSNIGFSDVQKDSWYGEETAKAVAAGYVDNQNNARFNPFSNITRLEAAIMVKRVFGLELKDKRLLDKINDAEALDAKQLEDFAAVIEKGGLVQISEGRYAPTGVLKLLDALKMLEACAGQVVTKSGTISDNVSGNMLVNTGAVTLKSMNISGDLTIGEGAGEGDIRLDGVSINGKLIIRGGGPNSVNLTNTKINGFLVVDKSAGNVRVKTTGTTTIEETYVKSGCILEEVNLTSGKGFVDIITEKSFSVGQTAEFKGDFNKLTVSESNININLSGKAGTVDISQGAAGNFTLKSGSISTLTTKASKNIIEISGGTVSTINIDAGAKGNKLTVNGATTISNINIKENTTISFQKGTIENLTLDSASEGSKLDILSGAYLKNIVCNGAATITGSGSITNAYVYASNVSMSIKPSGEYVKNSPGTATPGSTVTDPALPKIVITNASNRTILVGSSNQKLNAAASNGAEMFYSSADNSIVTVSEKGVLSGISAGTATVHISALKTGYTSAIATITVNVVSDNVSSAGSLEVSPAAGNAGAILDNFIIRYTAGESMTSGRVVIKLPAGFQASERDTVSIGSGAETALTKAQIIDAFTLSFSNVALASGDTIEVRLKNKEIPSGTQFVFSAVADADGMGPKLPAGEVSCTFTSDSLKVLQTPANYSEPVPGTEAGTTRIERLTFANVFGAGRWLISDTVAVPVFDQVLAGTAYEEKQNITAVAGQQLMLAAVDNANRVKAYAIITVDAEDIRKDDADVLDPATIDIEPGIQAGAVRINGLGLINVSGATAWMVRVQDTPSAAIVIDSIFEGAAYTGGTDIKANDSQYIVLAAVDSETGKHVKAYVSIPAAGKVSLPAGDLVKGTNYTEPVNGASVGAIMIKSLTSGGMGIDAWKYAVLSGAAVRPAMNAAVSDYENYYTGSESFVNYSEEDDISVAAGQHVLLVGTTSAGSIKAYADITVTAEMIRRDNAPVLQPGTDFSLPVMGTEAGTTRFTYLSPNLAGSSLTVNGWKYMYSIQDSGWSETLQINSKLTGAQNCAVNTNIPVTRGANKQLVLLITDAGGLIKAYANIAMQDDWIRPADALKLETALNDYSTPAPGTTSGAIRLELSSHRVSGFANWRYKLADTDFEVPYMGSEIAGTYAYTSGNDIENVKPGAYLLVIAVDGSGKTLAYLKEKIIYTQIKQPDAGKLVSSAEASVNFNYSVPAPGDKAGQTRIALLSFWGVNEAIAWRYKIVQANPPETVEYNSVATNSQAYYANLSVSINDGEYLVLYAVDSKNQIKAFRNIKVNDAQIKTPDAPELKLGTNYSAPAAGSSQGAIAIKELSFIGLDSSGTYTGWTWRYAVGNTKFSIPAKNSSIGAISGTDTLTTTTNILVSPKQYVLLLAVDSTGIVRGYANIYVAPEVINPGDADEIPGGNYKLVKGTLEGTTRFDKLETVGLDPAVTKWMIKVQPGELTGTLPKNTKVTGSSQYQVNTNISVQVGEHIILLATDLNGNVKAYADITVTEAEIQAPFALSLVLNKNYTLPVQGSTAGTVRMVLQDTDIPKDTSETIVWKYKKSTAGYKAHYNDSAPTGTVQFTEFIECQSSTDMAVEPGYWLLAATIGDKIKAYKVLNIDESLITPSEAPALTGDNYKAPSPGDLPGTAKIEGLTFIGVTGSETCIWKVKISNSDEKLMSNSSLVNTDINSYISGSNIPVRAGQYIVLAAVDAANNYKVRAYKSIQVGEGQVNAPALTATEHYSALKPGTVKDTTVLNVFPEATKYVVKVVDNVTNLTAGSITAYAAGDPANYDYSSYREYVSGYNISASAGKYVLLAAVSSSDKVLAYVNIKVLDSSLRKGDAALLKTPQNYSPLEAGAGISTVKISELDFGGLPVSEKVWVVKVQDASPAAIEMDSIIQVTSTYSAGSDIYVSEGQFVILYAAEKISGQASNGKVKGYAVLEVGPGIVKGVAPQLQLASPVLLPGATLNTTTIDVSKVTMPVDTTTLKYIVQNNGAGIILKDSQSTVWKNNTSGSSIEALEGQHLLLAATDSNGLIKAYADITVTASHLRSIIATLGGTVFPAVSETDIAAGGKIITITLDSAEWAEGAATTNKGLLLGGFKASGTEAEAKQWTNVMNKVTFVEKLDNKTIQIKLSEAAYDITANQEITLTIPAALIKGAVKPVVAKDTINIAAVSSAEFALKSAAGASITSLTEDDINNGKAQIIITLKHGKFASDADTSEVKRNAIFDGLKAANNEAEWKKVIDALKAAGKAAINLNSENKITITLQEAEYEPLGNELISVTIPCKTGTGEAVIAGAVNDAAATVKITIYANISVGISGTLVSSPTTEADIVIGGKTLVLALTKGKWASDIVSNETVRNALFNGLTVSPVVSAKETEMWTKKVLPALQAAAKLTGQTVIKRTGDTVVEITLPAVAGYEISADQYIAVNIPAACIAGGIKDKLAAAQSIKIINLVPAVAAAVKDVRIQGTVSRFKTGDTVTVNVEFDTAVDVTGKPVLKLSINKDAVYAAKAAVNVLAFEYKVTAGDAASKLDYKATTSLGLNGGTIINSGTSVNANITLPAPGKTGSLGDPLKTPIVIDAVAPAFVSTYPKEGTKTESTANILVKTNEESNIYCIVLTAGSTVPTQEQVVEEAKGNIAGTAVASDSIYAAANTESIFEIAGLSEYTQYTAYMVAEDIPGNRGAVTKLDFTTKDATAPVFTVEQKLPISDSKIEIILKADELGTAYLVALPAGSDTPTAQQVMAPGTIGVPTNLRATGSIATTGGITLTLTGLGFSAYYDIYAVCKDASGNVSAPVKTHAETSVMSFTGVVVDLSKKQISNTTALMEFSYDKDIWKTCTSGNTVIDYSDSADDLAVYIREKANPANVKQLGIFVRENENIINVSMISYDISQSKITNGSAVNLQYRIGEGAWGALNASASAINVVFVPDKKLKVRTAVTQTTLPSIEVFVDDIPVQEAAPELEHDDDTNEIKGLMSAYEYRIGTGTWTSGGTKGDFSGTKDVEVRKKATNRALPSKSQFIHFTAGLIKAVAAPENTNGKKTLTLTFEENTNKPSLANIKNWLLAGEGNITTGEITAPHDWGTDFTAKWAAADTIILEYNTLAGASIKIGDIVRITTEAGIQNAAGNSGSYSLKGAVAGRFNSVPSIESIKALDSGNQNGLNNGDRIVITFDQPVKQGNTLTKDNIGTYLTVKDKNGAAKTQAWAAVTINSSIIWNTSMTALTVIFDNIAAAADISLLLARSDKVTVETAWKLTDIDATTEYCNSSSLIMGSFTAAPEITSAVISNGGAGTLSVNDTVTITFSQPTNKKHITQALLRSYFKLLSADKKTAHSWGYQDEGGITWNAAGTVLTVKISSISGLTLVPGDYLTLDTSSDIMDKDEGVQAAGKDIKITN